MSGVKITDLTSAVSLTDTDLLVAVDTVTNTTKKITKGNLLSGLELSNIADSGDGVVVSGPLKVGDLTISDDETDAVLSFDSANDATFVGSVTATQFLGDGSQLTGVATASYIESGGDVVREFTTDSGSLVVGILNRYSGDKNPIGGYFQTGQNNTSIGQYAGGRWGVSDPSNGYKNTSVGKGAGMSSSNNRSVAIGYYAGYYNNSSAEKSIAIGYRAGGAWDQSSFTAAGSVNIGEYSGYYNKGDYSVSIGKYAGKYNGYNGVGGAHSTAIGSYAGYKNTGDKTFAAGYKAAYYGTGDDVIAIGSYAGYKNTGVKTFAAGYKAAYYNTGDYVVALGYNAGTGNTKDHYIEIKSTDSDGRMWFSKDSDWNFGTTVRASSFEGDIDGGSF